MKRWIVILFAFCSTVLFAQKSALDQKHTISLTNVNVNQALLQITDITKMNFTYDAEAISSEKLVSIDKTDCELREILNSVFDEAKYEYTVIGNNIVINSLEKSNKSLEYKLVRGRIVDGGTNETLSFAHVSLQNGYIGTISNQKGEFELKVPVTVENDSLLFSFLGYRKQQISINELDTTFLLIELKPYSVMLNQIVVTPIEPRKIVNNAIRKISVNYGDQTSMLTAFFRESYYQDSVLVNNSEAVLQIYKSSYAEHMLEDQIKILKGRKMMLKERPAITLKLKGGPYYMLKLDIVKNPLEFMKRNSVRYYDFEFKEIVYLNDRETYKLAFRLKTDVPLPVQSGYLFVDKETNGIARAEFDVKAEQAQTHSVANESQKGSAKNKIMIFYTKVHYEVNYSFLNGNWRLHSTFGEEVREVLDVKSGLITNVRTISQLVITGKTSEFPTRISSNEQYKPNEIFLDKIVSYDRNFWENYNIILP